MGGSDGGCFLKVFLHRREKSVVQTPLNTNKLTSEDK